MNDASKIELSDGSVFPFGTKREKRVKMGDVRFSYWRWFIHPDRSDLAAAWPNVAHYARCLLSAEMAQKAVAAGPKKKMVPKPEPVPRDPVKAQAALDELKKFRATLME